MPESYAKVETQIQEALAEISNCTTWTYLSIAREFHVPKIAQMAFILDLIGFLQTKSFLKHKSLPFVSIWIN